MFATVAPSMLAQTRPGQFPREPSLGGAALVWLEACRASVCAEAHEQARQHHSVREVDLTLKVTLVVTEIK
jgi:hypothetical protein